MVPIGHRHHHQGPVAEEDSISIPMGSLKKGPWSAAEDKILMEYVREHGEGNWNAVQRNTSLQRCGKSCRLRWANHLRPNLKKGAFSHEEERLIIDLHSKLGNKWARISAHLPGRTDNEVKNYWNTRVKRRLRQGLPLYPNHNNQTAPSFSSILSPQQPPSPPPAPPLPTHLKTSPSSLSFLDPTSLPFPPPFFSFNNPSFLSPSPALSTRVSLSGPSLVPFGSNSLQNFQTRVQSDPLSLGFEYKLELPSNQLRPKSAYDDDQTVYSYQANDAAAKFNPNIGERDNSGLLDALLPEAQSRAATTAGEMLNKDNLDGHQWGSIYDISSTGVNYTDGDLSSVIGVVASPKVSGGQSSSISDENLEPEFPEVSLNPEWLDSSESYTSWDNLPRIF